MKVVQQREADDKQVVEYAMENNLVIVTKDDKMIKQCKIACKLYQRIDLEKLLK